MNRLYLGLLLLVLPIVTGTGSVQAADTIRIGNKEWQATLDPQTGHMLSYSQHMADGQRIDIPFRRDTLAGISFKGITLSPVSHKPLSFEKQVEGIRYQLCYQPLADHLAVKVTVSNEGQTPFMPTYLRLVLGIDSEMHTYPQWDSKYFPTLLRCEKSFAWGYFMSPLCGIMAFGTEEPVASYDINYIYEGIKEWRWGHQIFTASLDLLHALPLPARHPQHLTSLEPGESRCWTLHLGGVPGLSAVKPALAKWIKAPLIEADAFTVVPGQQLSLRIESPAGIARTILHTPDGTYHEVILRPEEDERVSLALDTLPGAYRLSVTDQTGKQAEATFYVRKPWSWYLKQARQTVSQYPPLFSSSCESFYGYYPAFLAALHYPDAKIDRPLEERLCNTISLVVDTLTGLPRKDALPWRIQNFSSVAGILTDLWRATRREAYLTWASRIGDYLCSDSVQWKDGSYRAGKIHYTAVIYPAKSMFELAEAEKECHRITKKDIWKERSCRHEASAFRAVDDLQKRLDDIETEGDMTLEDGMVTCSALQLGLGGLSTPDAQLRKRYAEAARYMMDKHECLEQLLIPDARMRGATLRYWEILDIYFTPNQVMNSPHGWTGWKIYAMHYLYLLTGEERYLTGFMDALGAGAQLMGLDGTLRWGFIPDPYVDGLLCVPDTTAQGWKKQPCIVGEQYMKRISPWFRPDDETKMVSFGKKGGAGDHTTFEIFKAMEECVLTSAYVIVKEDGYVRSWNCQATLRNGTLTVVPAEGVVEKVHINTACPLKVKIASGGSTPMTTATIRKGMQWVHLTAEG